MKRFASMLLFIGLLTFSGSALANVGGVETTTGGLGSSVMDEIKSQPTGAETGKSLIQGVGLDDEAVAKSAKQFSPVAKIINQVIAWGVLLLSSFALIMSVSDMIYLEVPFTRNWLQNINFVSNDAQRAMAIAGVAMGQQQQGGQNGQGGFGGGFGGGQGGGFGGQGGGFGGGGFGGGGFGGGGFGGGAMQGQQGQQDQKQGGKSLLMSYIKIRWLTLVLIGVGIALFTTMFFTNLGLSLINFIL